MASAAQSARSLARSPWARLGAQLLVGLAIIAVLLSLDFASLWRLLATTDPRLLLAVLALTFVYTFLLSERWRLILRGLGAPQRPWPAFDLTMRGYFFGTFLPSNAGGDVVKAYLLSRRGVPLAVALLSAALDRVAGLVALAWVGAPAIWLAAGPIGAVSQASSLALFAAGVAVAVAVLLGPRLAPLLEPPALRLAPTFARPFVREASQAAQRLGGRPAVFLQATLLSIPLHLFYVYQIYLLAEAVGARADPARIAWAVAWGTIAGALPISFSGFGPRETAFVATLGPADVGVAIGLLSGLLQVASGLPGGVLQLLDRTPLAGPGQVPGD